MTASLIKGFWGRMLGGALVALAVVMLASLAGAPVKAYAQDAAPAATAAPSEAMPIRGEAHEWQLGFQKPASPVMEDLEGFHNKLILPIITAICLFVLLLLVTIMVRFNARANPVPSKNAHNTLIEVIWTVVPVMILVVIAIPSFRLLFKEARVPENAAVTIKATGKQWFWSYEYPDAGDIAFDSVLKPEEKLAAGEPRLLTTDTKLVVPVGKVVHVIVTGADVIHSWAVPALGVKIDAVPGRLNETWFQADEVGVYYGQCSELCGKDHAFMPIEVHVVSDQDYAQWVDWAKKEYAANDAAPINVAAATPSALAR